MDAVVAVMRVLLFVLHDGHRRRVLSATLLHNKLKVCILFKILHRSAL